MPLFLRSPAQFSSARRSQRMAGLCLAVLFCLAASTPVAEAGSASSGFAVGVNIHNSVGLGIDKMAAMGATWVRGDAVWAAIEPAPGVYNFSKVDAFVTYARARGLQVYLNISGSPTWASSSGRLQAVPAEAAWTSFIGTLARRYGTRIGAYGIWNEPNLRWRFWDGTVADYVNILLRPAYRAIKAINPALLVAGPDVGSSVSADPRTFLADFSRLGGYGYLNLVSFHAYADTVALFDASVGRLLSIIPKGKPIYLTEFGWDSRAYGQTTQANDLTGAIAYLATTHRVQVAMIYSMRDNTATDVRTFGLLRYDLSAKPAVAAVRAAIARYRR